ncbi:ubiquinone biosynthesis protein COQ3, mitochondrial [Xylocopa sonorina]|uniref:ubiquinone biosynthesis protein COQ3, mitochondrial n=1 Tax=Xylocopa sonorina TaxID=1818115 RepID=UPI00403B05CE
MRFIRVSCRSISGTAIIRSRLTEKMNQQNGKSTVDNSQIKILSSKRDDWWWGGAKDNILYSFNTIRVKFISDGLANAGLSQKIPYLPLEGLHILDVGCGGGLLSESLARLGGNVTGLDASDSLITVAKEHATLDASITERLNYTQGAIEEFVENNKEKFDAVVASEVIEHVNNKEIFLKHCIETLKPGGSIFITTFNKTFVSWIGGILVAEYLLNLIPRGTHEWRRFTQPVDMQSLLEKCKTCLSIMVVQPN